MLYFRRKNVRNSLTILQSEINRRRNIKYISIQTNNITFFYMVKTFQIIPEKYGFPSKIGDFTVRTVTWKDFSGKAPQNTWFLAYTYWNTNYNCVKKNNKNIVIPSVSIGTRSWCRAEDDFQLLQHQCGHYWIACLCALQFQKRINYTQKQPSDVNFGDWCKMVLNQTMKQFSSMQRQYDKQTYHYLNRDEQKDWQKKMSKMFNEYNRFFLDKSKEDQQNQLKVQKQKESQKRMASFQVNKNIKANQNSRRAIQLSSLPKEQKFVVRRFGVGADINSNSRPKQVSKSRNAARRVIGGFQMARQTIIGRINELNQLKN